MEFYKSKNSKYCHEKLNVLDKISLRKIKESGDYNNFLKFNNLFPYKVDKCGIYGTYNWLINLTDETTLDINEREFLGVEISWVRQIPVLNVLKEIELNFSFFKKDGE